MKRLRGSAIAYALTIMTIVMILLSSIVGFIVSQLQYSLKQDDKEQALQIAEAGVHFYKWYLAHQLDGRTASQVQAFWANTSPYPLGVHDAYEGAFSNGVYSVVVIPPDPSQTIISVESTGWTTANSELKRKIKVRLRKPSWSENAIMSNEKVRIGVGTEIFGPMHSNNGIRVDGLAHNLVTSSVDVYDDSDHNGVNEFGVHTHKNVPPATGITVSVRPAETPPSAVPERTDVFEAGRSFPVSPVDFNGILGDLSLMKSEAQAGRGKYFDATGQGRHIILKTNGTYDVCRVQSVTGSINQIDKYDRVSGNGSCTTCAGACVQNYPIVNNGAIFVENNVWLEGTVNNKRITVVAANLQSSAYKSVYIGRDIRYTNYNCDEMIGIVGQQDIEIYKNSNDNLYIDGALIAQRGRVGRLQYVGGSGTNIKTTITLFGALSSNQRYGFAWSDIATGNHVSGYINRVINYDNNLLYCPPPYFPTGSQYKIDLWEEL